MQNGPLIATLNKTERGRFASAANLKLLDGVLAGLIALVAFGAVIWAARGGAPGWMIPALVVAMLLLMVARYWAGAAAMRQLYGLAFEAGTRLRHRLLRHLIRLPLSAFYTLHAGKVADRKSTRLNSSH